MNRHDLEADVRRFRSEVATLKWERDTARASAAELAAAARLTVDRIGMMATAAPWLVAALERYEGKGGHGS
jgi:hypothetical protein